MTVVDQKTVVDQVGALLPAIVLGFGACWLLLLGAWKGKRCENPVHHAAAWVVAALVSVGAGAQLAFSGETTLTPIVWDQFSYGISGLLLVALLGVLAIGGASIGPRFATREGVVAAPEYYALMLLTTAGALVFVAADEFILLFLGLELMSMGVYALCGSAIGHLRSAESALKYFILGSVGSAILLYGLALLFGATGSTEYTVVAEGIASADVVVVRGAIALVLAGVAFKLALVPFHIWSPDVYEGAPTPVTAFMATVIKVAAVAVAYRLFATVLEPVTGLWLGAVWTLIVVTVLYGSAVALVQRSVKRMLAYSSISNAGFLALALLIPGGQGVAAGVLYLAAYVVMSLGAFAVHQVVTGDVSEMGRDDLSRYHGLAKRSPFLALAMTVFLFALAGLPPGFAGMLGKLYLLQATMGAGYTGLVVVAVVASMVAIGFYLRVVVAMYFTEETRTSSPLAIPVGVRTVAAVGMIIVVLAIVAMEGSLGVADFVASPLALAMW